MTEESSLIKVFDGDILVDLIDNATNADRKSLTLFEREILRIFREYKNLQETARTDKQGIQWISVKERLPRKEGTYLTLNPAHDELGIMTVHFKKDCWCCNYASKITHWSEAEINLPE